MSRPLVRRLRKDEVGFQLAPMIDMTFLLLVFFMLTTKISKEQIRLDVALPLASAATIPAEPAGREIINLDVSGRIYFGERPVVEEELLQILTRRFAGARFPRIYLRADAATDVRHVKRVMAVCAEAGAAEVLFDSYKR